MVISNKTIMVGILPFKKKYDRNLSVRVECCALHVPELDRLCHRPHGGDSDPVRVRRQRAGTLPVARHTTGGRRSPGPGAGTRGGVWHRGSTVGPPVNSTGVAVAACPERVSSRLSSRRNCHPLDRAASSQRGLPSRHHPLARPRPLTTRQPPTRNIPACAAPPRPHPASAIYTRAPTIPPPLPSRHRHTAHPSPATHWPTAHEPHIAAAARRRRRRGAARRRVQGPQGLPQHTQGHLAALLVLHQLLRVVVLQRRRHHQQQPPAGPGPGAQAEAAAAAAAGDHLHALAQGHPHQPARLHVHRAEAHRPRQPRPRPRRAPGGGRQRGPGRRRRAGRVVVLLVRELRQRPRRGAAAASLRGLAADAPAGPAAGRALHGARHPAVRARRVGPAPALRAEGVLRPVPAGRRRGARPGDGGGREQRRRQRWGRVLPVHGGGDADVSGL
jgi:hypothetical protein